MNSVEYTIGIGTIVIAAFTAALFFLQYLQHRHEKKASRANYKLFLFDKRMGTYIALEEMFSSFMRDGQPKLEAATKLRYEARHADLLFPENDEVILFLNVIIKKSFDRAYAWADWEPLRERAFAGEILSSNEFSKKEDSFKKMDEIDGWFI